MKDVHSPFALPRGSFLRDTEISSRTFCFISCQIDERRVTSTVVCFY